MSDLTGELIDGRYQLLRQVANGGMASIYEAIDTRLDRKVAVKIMHPHLAQDEAFVSRFIKEAKAAAALSHPKKPSGAPVAALLAALGAEVYTFESRKLFKDKVKILFQVLGYTKVHLIEETQFNNFVFDKIICNGVLNIDKVELYKRLKTGGVFYVTTFSNKLFEFNLFENK